MRDKYIELIINYVKQKPGYETALDDVKKDVIQIGATEAEFEEAIRRITGVNQNPTITQTGSENTQFILQNTTQPQSSNPKDFLNINKIQKLINLAKTFASNKKYVAATAFLLILIIGLSQFIKIDNSPKNAKIAQNISKPVVAPIVKPAIPVVYANSFPVDAQKIFSIKSSNVQLTVTGKPKKEVLGFFPYWMLSKYNDINLSTLTSISLFGLEADSGGNIVTKGDTQADGGWSMWKNPTLDKLINKARSYGIKIYLTIKAFNSNNIDKLTQSDAAQKNLIANVLYLVNSKNLDGVNIDFEYVGSPTEATTQGFTRFITNLNAELKRQNPKSTLTIDTYLVSGSDRGIFNIPVLSLNCDAFIIMGYDMHTPNGAAGPVAAMGGETNIVGYVQNFLEKVDSSKIILAVPYYGYAWPQTTDSSNNQAIVLPYAEIAQTNQNAQLTWDDASQTPSYTYKDALGLTRVVYFDNVRSLAIKYDFINKKDLRGVGIWALGYDGQNQDLEKLLIDKFINL